MDWTLVVPRENFRQALNDALDTARADFAKLSDDELAQFLKQGEAIVLAIGPGLLV